LKLCIAFTKLETCKILDELEALNNHLAQILDLIDELWGER